MIWYEVNCCVCKFNCEVFDSIEFFVCYLIMDKNYVVLC